MSSERPTTLCGTPAGCDSVRRRDGDLAVDAGEAELDPALEHDDEMRRHVVPVPAGLGVERPDGADVLGADPAAGAAGQAEIAIFGVGARAVAGEGAPSASTSANWLIACARASGPG